MKEKNTEMSDILQQTEFKFHNFYNKYAQFMHIARSDRERLDMQQKFRAVMKTQGRLMIMLQKE